MTKRTALTIGMSALLGGALVGGIAFADPLDGARAAKMAAANAAKAIKANSARRADVAVGYAEAAVAMLPQNASYRALLGDSYLKAGRFISARDALSDALVLAPNDGRVALGLALAQIGAGEWDAARKTLDAHADSIPVGDRGLAMALAGDPAGAVELLVTAARSPDATAKVRQNLALALALAGRWNEARAVASLDIAPAEVDQRMTQWASFVNPVSASDQVASLLGVTPVQDAGQPVRLALNTNPVQNAAASAEGYAPGQVAAVQPAIQVAAQAQVAIAPPLPNGGSAVAPVSSAPVAAPVFVAPVATASAASSVVIFGASTEVVQALPATSAAVAPVKAAATATFHANPKRATPAPARGDWKRGNYFVQIGAYQNSAVAREKWLLATRRYAAFASHAPNGMAFNAKRANFYRVSVGGFSRPTAVAMCADYKAHGGACFVRLGAGDQLAAWAKDAPRMAQARKNKPVQLASR